MTDLSYAARVVYAAAIDEAFAAAASPGGHNGWWTTHGDVVTEAGSLVRLDWSDTDYVVFRVDAYTRPTTMRWTCVEQHDTNLPRPDEWVGTTLAFDFAAIDERTTEVAFAHHGLVPRLACYGACEAGWDFFLRTSIRGLAERGAGVPFHAAMSAA